MVSVQEWQQLAVEELSMHVVKKAVRVFLPSNSFSAQSRLRSKADFKRAFQGIRVGSKEFVVYAKPASIAKLGIVISKKNLKLAVRRNRVKRVTREWYRTQQEAPGFELIVIANRAADALTNPAIRECLDRLLQRLNARQQPH